MRGWLTDMIRADNRTTKTNIIMVGIGKSTMLLRMRSDFHPFDESARSVMAKAYSKSKNRLILLDNEGTLGPSDPFKGNEFLAQVAPLSEPVENILRVLAADPHNTICVISGRERDHMQDKFGGIKNLGIAAENGYYHAWVNENQPLEFSKLMEIKDWGWKETVLDILKSYKDRTDGSFIVNKDCSARWFYRDVDTDFGIKESNELVAHLQIILENLPLDIVHGKGYVEVKPRGIGKGTYTNQMLDYVRKKKGDIDFILCMGDSTTDEETFASVKEAPRSATLEVSSLLRRIEKHILCDCGTEGVVGRLLRE